MQSSDHSSRAGYFAAEFADSEERQRLSLLEARLDPVTQLHLERLGVGRSDGPKRCLEVGAGGGSVARWLADRVAPHGGHVVAADIDVRFLNLAPHPGVVIRDFDITKHSFEPLHYDFVHARALLMHLGDPEGATQKMADAVAPGGILLVEEWDYGTVNSFSDHPDADVVQRVNDALCEFMVGIGVDVFVGRRLPDLLRATGLQQVEHLGTLPIVEGAPVLTMQKASAGLLRPALLRSGKLTDADLERWRGALDDPAFRMTDFATISAWARRPTL